MKSEIEAYIRRRGLFSPGERVLAAVSGGRDSVVLLHILYELADKLGITLAAAHVHHGLRGAEADRDAEFVRSSAQDLDLPFHLLQIKPSTSLERQLGPEAALRQQRYEALFACMAEHGYHKLALGHHLQDQAETLLLRLLRGTGLRGLGGMRPLHKQRVRPLLETHPDAIQAFAQARGLHYVEDSSNREEKYLRNKVRRELLPLLRGYQPRFMERLGGLTRQLEENEEAWETRMQALWREKASETADGILMPLSGLASLAPAELKRLFIMAYERLNKGPQGLDTAHLERLVDLTNAGAASWKLTMPKDVSVAASCGMLLFHQEASETHYTCLIEGTGRYALKAASLTVDADYISATTPAEPPDPWTCLLHAAALPLLLRRWQPGDRIRLPSGRTRKVQDLFTDSKIPRWQRHRHPCLLQGNELLWVAGLTAAAPKPPKSGPYLRIRIENGPSL